MDRAPENGPVSTINPEAFAANLARLVEEGGRAMAAYLKPREESAAREEMAEEMATVLKTLGQVAEYWLADPKRALEAQTSLIQGYLNLWAATMHRMAGEPAEPVATPDARDRRFSDPDWTANPFFDALKQAYLLTSDWAARMVRDAEGIDAHTRHKADFYVRQLSAALSPSNFVLTNPELLRETFASNAENLVRGMKMLSEDIEAGKGELKIRQSSSDLFEVGKNLATTPGKVVFENELLQLIQYSPSTAMVLKTPVLIVPPWINKFYVLDLAPEKSFLKWMVDRGLTVFVISWVNPDARLAAKSFEDY
ncbi:MAG TPA: class I poly(R)-hydroxyalkanoic acid synthase, partial [Xanthobacteraceae bacterium]|nr:class I poly(R)-hydroxyalkanoic acid synthase [Xanthobacteraceae bacterium]